MAYAFEKRSNIGRSGRGVTHREKGNVEIPCYNPTNHVIRRIEARHSLGEVQEGRRRRVPCMRSEELLRGLYRARGPTTSCAARGAAPLVPHPFPSPCRLNTRACMRLVHTTPWALPASPVFVEEGGMRTRGADSGWVSRSTERDRKSNRWFFFQFHFIFFPIPRIPRIEKRNTRETQHIYVCWGDRQTDREGDGGTVGSDGRTYT